MNGDGRQRGRCPPPFAHSHGAGDTGAPAVFPADVLCHVTGSRDSVQMPNSSKFSFLSFLSTPPPPVFGIPLQIGGFSAAESLSQLTSYSC